MAKTAYISDGPTLDGAVKVSGNGPGQASSSQTAMPTGAVTGSSASGQSQLEDATTGSMPVVNTLTVETNQDGTIGIKTTVADAMPETGPGASSRNGSASASTGSVSSVGVQTGWVQVGAGYKYYKEDGSGYKTGWHYEYNADGSKIWYYLDEAPDNKEWMVTGWKKIVRGDGVLSWYHFRVDGKMSRYWECLDGWWYYFEPRDDAGYMVSDWYILNNEYYYFNTDADKGYMQIDWLEIRGKWYYFHKTDEKRGIMAANHMVNHTDGNKYYLGSDGAMVVSITFKSVEDGKTYKADANGICTEDGQVLIGNKDEIGSTAEFKRKYGSLVSKLANQLGVDENLLGAVILVESSGSGFKDGNLLIRFENHHFVKYTGTSYTTLFYYNASEKWKDHKFRKKATDSWITVHTGEQSSEYDTFNFAKSLNEDAAYKSISMGLGQIMGFNYTTCGYSSAKEMFGDFNSGHQQQIIGMVEFIKKNNNGKTLQALQNNNISSFVTQYNGSGNVSNYTSKITTKKGEYQNA